MIGPERILERMEDNKALYRARKEAKLCVRCGSPLTNDDMSRTHGTRCKPCRSVMIKGNAERLRERRRKAGLCVYCGRVLIGTQRAEGVCDTCKVERPDPSSYKQTLAAANSLVETMKWLKRRSRNRAADGMYPECVGCPWLRRKTDRDPMQYCPSASGTSPATKDCLRFIIKTENRKKIMRGELNEQCESDGQPGGGPGAEADQERQGRLHDQSRGEPDRQE